MFFVLFSFVDSPLVLWCCWLGLLTCKNRLPYNLYCICGDVKHCSIDRSIDLSVNSFNWKRRHVGILIIIQIIYYPINGYPDSKLSVLSIPSFKLVSFFTFIFAVYYISYTNRVVADFCL